MILVSCHKDYFDLAVNLRPIGFKDNLTPNGKFKVFRSATPASYSDADWDKLINHYGVKTFIDLRDSVEVGKVSPRSRIQDLGLTIHYKHFPLALEGNILRQKRVPLNEDYAQYYLDLVTNCSHTIGNIFAWLADEAELPLVIACFAGKDRTGLISFLLLSMLEESYESILNDYELSGTYLNNKIDFFEEKWLSKGLTREDYLNRMAADRKTLEIFIERFLNQHGSVGQYFERLGISGETLNKIKTDLL